MRIDCLHGYFKFQETTAGQIFEFADLFELDISPFEDFYTFDSLLEAPDYAILGGEYLGAAAIKTYEGKPWEIMRANGLIYDFENDIVKPILTVTQIATISQAKSYFLADGLILPGSVTEDGSRVKDYSAWFSRSKMQFLYSAVSYV